MANDLAAPQRAAAFSTSHVGGRDGEQIRGLFEAKPECAGVAPSGGLVNLELAVAQCDLQALDDLHSSSPFLRQLLGRVEDIELASCSDEMNTAMDGYD